MLIVSAYVCPSLFPLHNIYIYIYLFGGIQNGSHEVYVVLVGPPVGSKC